MWLCLFCVVRVCFVLLIAFAFVFVVDGGCACECCVYCVVCVASV